MGGWLQEMDRKRDMESKKQVNQTVQLGEQNLQKVM